MEQHLPVPGLPPTVGGPGRRARRRGRTPLLVAALLTGSLLLSGVGLAVGGGGGDGGGDGPGPAALRLPDGDEPDGSPEGAPTGPRKGDADVVRRDPDDPMAEGEVDAPVVLSFWYDLRCPHCATVFADVLPTVREEYVASGKVRIEYNDVAFLGPDSLEVAVAARAAAEQGTFLAFHEAVADRDLLEVDTDELVAAAEEAQVPDVEAFTEALEDPALAAAVRASEREARTLGADAVPFLVVGERTTVGAPSVDALRAVLDAALTGEAPDDEAPDGEAPDDEAPDDEAPDDEAPSPDDDGAGDRAA